MPPQDADRVRAAQRGDRAALEGLLLAYQDRLFSYLLRMVRDPARAEDLLQDTYVRVIGAIGSYEERRGFAGWLFTIAANLVRDHYRTRHPAASLDATPEGDDEGGLGGALADPRAEEPWEIAERRWSGESLRKAVEDLPPAQREVVLLRVYAGLSFKEIAEAVGCPLNTALGRMHYALAALREKLSDKSDRSGKSESMVKR